MHGAAPRSLGALRRACCSPWRQLASALSLFLTPLPNFKDSALYHARSSVVLTSDAPASRANVSTQSASSPHALTCRAPSCSSSPCPPLRAYAPSPAGRRRLPIDSSSRRRCKDAVCVGDAGCAFVRDGVGLSHSASMTVTFSAGSCSMGSVPRGVSPELGLLGEEGAQPSDLVAHLLERPGSSGAAIV